MARGAVRYCVQLVRRKRREIARIADRHDICVEFASLELATGLRHVICEDGCIRRANQSMRAGRKWRPDYRAIAAMYVAEHGWCPPTLRASLPADYSG
jgi:hypothetical protein